ncbi:hypothetical protein HK101_005256 [Irineochytrium annulatum]|nr:hypothetical protein HK101_005256 [Irineochytrium annulatum]
MYMFKEPHTAQFRFSTRIQKLNSMEGTTRTTVTFLDQLEQFHLQHGVPFNRTPMFFGRVMDLHLLKKSVTSRGGFDKVSELKKWSEIGRVLGAEKGSTSASCMVKTSYSRWILPFEDFVSMADQVPLPPDPAAASLEDLNYVIGEICEVCKMTSTTEESLAICDSCDRGFHIRCTKATVAGASKVSEWFCPLCIQSYGIEFGFQDGRNYSLAEFFHFSSDFKKGWFEKKKGIGSDAEGLWFSVAQS